MNDAAALVAVSPTTIDSNPTDAGRQSKPSAVATAVFDARVPTGISVTDFSVTPTRSGTADTAVVAYRATTDNLFGDLLESTSQIAGEAASTYAALDITKWGAGSSPRWAPSQLAAQIGGTGNGVTASPPPS